MASIALRHKSHHLNLKSHHTLFNFSRLYSSSSSNNDNGDNQPPKTSSFSSYFAKIKPKSDHQQSSQYDEIRKNLSQFRDRSSPNTPRPNPNPNPNPNPTPSVNVNSSFSNGYNLSFDKIRQSLVKIRDKKLEDRGNNAANQQFSLNNLKQNLTPNSNTSRVIGGSLENLPIASFGKEIREKSNKKSDENDSERFSLVKPYSHAELGKELKELRPDVSKNKKKDKKKEGEEGWFTLSELQGRLAKLQEIEDERNRKNFAQKNGGPEFLDLRKSFENIRIAKDPKQGPQRLDILSQPGFMISSTGPPQEHLIEKYFHPDNMSAAEKLKLELKKVREEFKMSESDCGSTRVQIAQLTTEIHHLSSVLHKKDKHSRRGLHGKVQQRKKLLKYLRRTDWDSYCFVLTKLGLRDNPDYKN